MIKVSRSLKELAYRAYTCQDKLRKKWGRDPTLLELARALEVEPEELTAALEADSDVESLHKPIYQKDGHEIELMDKLEEKECREEELLNHIVLGELLKRLAGEERQLIYLRYFANKTQGRDRRSHGDLAGTGVTDGEEDIEMPGELCKHMA